MMGRAWDTIKDNYQIIINILVAVQLVALVVIGVVAFQGEESSGAYEIPDVSGEEESDISMMMEMMDYVMNPDLIGGVFNSNPDFVSGLVSKMDPAVVAGAVNDNPDFMSAVLDQLDPQVVDALIAGSSGFMSRVVGALDPATLAGIINDNPGFLSDLATSLNPDVLAAALNSEPFAQWLSGLLSRVDPAVMARLINENQGLVAGLLASLDQAGMASALNSNPQFLNGVLSNLDISGLDPAVVGALVNDNPDWLSALVGQLNSAVMASVLGNNQSFVVEMVNAMGSEPISQLIDSLAAGVLGSVTIRTHVSLDAPLFDMFWFDANAILTGSSVSP
ncbi:MAG: hypothetical protein ACOC78_00625 [Actinomycetota bacterium]